LEKAEMFGENRNVKEKQKCLEKTEMFGENRRFGESININ
jgi:hypothetical protein